jgi:predicted lipoprotein with Yx(FWY)xxD motif
MKKSTYAFALLAALAALVIAGCGGGGSSSSSSSSSEAAGGEGSGGGMTVSAAEVSGLGPILVDSEGMTVYEFTEDNGTTSSCYGGCEEEWPPVVASGKPTAGEGAMAADLGTTKRKDGTVQVTYKGHPIYTFADDESPGEANGNEDDGTWFVLNEAGSAVEGKATAATGGDGDQTTTVESSGGGGGY